MHTSSKQKYWKRMKMADPFLRRTGVSLEKRTQNWTFPRGLLSLLSWLCFYLWICWLISENKYPKEKFATEHFFNKIERKPKIKLNLGDLKKWCQNHINSPLTSIPTYSSFKASVTESILSKAPDWRVILIKVSLNHSFFLRHFQIYSKTAALYSSDKTLLWKTT